MDAIAEMAVMIQAAEEHATSSAGDRTRALEYYQGEMKDTPSDVGRSKLVKRDLRAHVKKVLPSLMRTLLGSSQLVEFLPIGPEDEEGAAQSTDYMNEIVVPEAEAPTAIEDALHDALLLRNGILHWWYDERTTVSVSRHTGLTEEAFAELVSGDDVEVLEHSEAQEETELGPVITHDLKIRRNKKKGEYRAASIPRDRFLIHPDAVSLEESPVVGDKCSDYRRSDLVAMGYDKDLVFGLPISTGDKEQDALRDTSSSADDIHRANEPIDYYNLYIRFDMDGDGIAELRHVVFAGGLTEKNLLLNEECDEIQYADIKVMSQPHQWEGISLADDLMELQQAGTVLLRQTVDNLYWANNLQPTVQDKAIKDMESVYSPEFGKPIVINAGMDVRSAIGFHQVPFVADKSFGMLEYFDKEGTERTGVSDASSGLAPDALQNMTAKASAMIEQAGIGQTELMVSTAAKGLRKFFQGLLRLVIRHQDVPRMIKLRGEWVEFDPRQWNAEMDCSVNTGLGAGTRERDMIVMQQVIGLQEKLVAAFGPDNPFVKPENVFNAISKLTEAAGLRSVEPYFTEPDLEEIKAKMEAAKNAPNPEQMKLEAQMKLEQAKMQSAQAKEKAQMDADLMVKQAEIAASTQAQSEKLQSDALLLDKKLAFEREKLAAELQNQREDTRQRRQDEIWKAQAANAAALMGGEAAIQ